MPAWHGLTIAASGRLAVLESKCEICQSYDATTALPPHPAYCAFLAIWDTGASNSVITQKVVDQCGLKPTGMTEVFGVNGKHAAETYIVNIRLHDAVTMTEMRVTKGILNDRNDVLIGLDVINFGDFAVTNGGGTTTFSFRIPSQGHVDYVKDHNALKAIEAAKRPQQAWHRRKKEKKAKKR